MIAGDYSGELVQRVNELYHDLVSERYHQEHPEIFDYERQRWERAGERFFRSAKPLKVLDLGSGTGFVPLATAVFLKAEDVFICSDISGRVLDQARKNIQACEFACQFKYVKLEPEIPFHLPFERGYVEIIALNSVLHHVKDTGAFLSEIDRILKPDGLLLIGHEPNSYFFSNLFLRLVSRLTNPRMAIDELAIKYPALNSLKKFARSLFARKRKAAASHEKMTAQINEKLLEEKIIDRKLLPEEIKEITDIRAREGFKPDRLLAGFEILHLETYNYLGSQSGGRGGMLARKYESLLGKAFPRSGATFFVVLKKGRNIHQTKA